MTACLSILPFYPSWSPWKWRRSASRPLVGTAVSGCTDASAVQGGPVDELLGAAVERSALDQFEVEVGRALEDRVRSGLSGDHGEERHLEAVDQAGGHQGPVHREAAVRAQRHVGLL